MDQIILGVMYFSAGIRTPVEAGFRTLGHTSYDEDLKQHAFWFPSVAEFEKVKRELFEMNGYNRPVPCWKSNPAWMAANLKAEAPTAAVAPPPPPVVTSESKAAAELADDIFNAHGGKAIRLNDFAVKVGLPVDLLRAVIEKDARYQAIPGNGWVRLTGDNSPTE